MNRKQQLQQMAVKEPRSEQEVLAAAFTAVGPAFNRTPSGECDMRGRCSSSLPGLGEVIPHSSGTFSFKMRELSLFLRLSAPDVATMYEQGPAAARTWSYCSEDASSRKASVPVSGFTGALLSSVAAQKNSRWPERLRRRR